MKTNTAYIFKSGLSEQITGFIEEKQRLGFKYENLDMFRTLDRFSMNFRCENYMPKELVLDWVKKRPNQAPATASVYLGTIRRLAIYMQRKGLDAYVAPTNIAPVQTHEHIPYIFTHGEIKRIFHVVDHLKLNHTSPNRHLAFPLIFRLLYCCGMRISEVLSLRLQDYEQQDGIITVTNAKMYRDRLIPLDKNLNDMMKSYIQKVSIQDSKDLLFPSPTTGNIYPLTTIRVNFRGILWKSQISYGGKNVGPRIHDFRHTFCVHCLQRFVSENRDLYVALPILAAYLGHKSTVGTSRYLHLTAEVYPELAERLESLYGGILPEWTGDSDEAY